MEKNVQAANKQMKDSEKPIRVRVRVRVRLRLRLRLDQF